MRVGLALLLLCCSCEIVVSPTEERATEARPTEAAVLSDPCVYVGWMRVPWVRTHLYREHDCLSQYVELWTRDSGVADIEVWRTAYMAPTPAKVLWAYGVEIGGMGYHVVPMKGLIAGRMLHLYTVVHFRSSGRGTMLYAPDKAAEQQAVSWDGTAWEPWANGEIGAILEAPLQVVTMTDSRAL